MFRSPSFSHLLPFLALSVVACTDDSEPATSDDTDPAALSAAFGVISVPSTTDGTTTSYLMLTDALAGTIDPADAVVELTGRAIAGSPETSSQVYVGSSAGSELTRYDYTDGTLVESGRVDFAAQQVTSFAGYSSQLQFIDEDTGYWFGRDGRIVVWNPEAMTVDSAIDLPEMIREDPAWTDAYRTFWVDPGEDWDRREVASMLRGR